MSKIEDLKKSLTSMSREELLEKVSEIRADRRVSKTAISRSAAIKENMADKMAKKIKGLSPEERAAFLKLIGETDEDNPG